MCVCHKSSPTHFFLTEKYLLLGDQIPSESERERKTPFSSLHNFSITQTRNPNCQKTPVKKEEAGRQAGEHGPRSQGLKFLLFEEFRVYVTD
jgi:hypothetical protein